MTLDVGDFIRRFLIHVLPKGFHRIRHYGLFASANRAKTIARARELLGLATPAAEAAGENEAFRTRTTKGFPRWSMTRYAAARPNMGPASHSTPRASPKRVVNAAQSKPISQTSRHNNVVPEPSRLPHTHIRAIKSP